jgi:hypothetical protein
MTYQKNEQLRSPAGRRCAKKILIVDSQPVACSALARGLKQKLGCEVLCTSLPHEAMRCLRVEKDSVGVIVYTLELGPETGLSFVRTIKEHCKAEAIRIPKFLVLTPGELTGGYEGRFQINGAECLLLGYEKQVCSTVRRMMSQSACEKGRPTIIVDRSESEPRFFVLGGALLELIACGPRLIPILNYLAIHYGTEISTRTLAEVADITEASVRVYLSRLRTRYDEARLKVGIEIPGKEVFRTFRRDGDNVHMLDARVKFR